MMRDITIEMMVLQDNQNVNLSQSDKIFTTQTMTEKGKNNLVDKKIEGTDKDHLIFKMIELEDLMMLPENALLKQIDTYLQTNKSAAEMHFHLKETTGEILVKKADVKVEDIVVAEEMGTEVKIRGV